MELQQLYRLSDESWGDFLDDNEYEFTQHGSKWDGDN